MKPANGEKARAAKIKNMLKIALIAGLIAMMSSVAWGRPGRSQPREPGPRPGYRVEKSCVGVGCNNGRARKNSAGPVSSVPEPSAALLFAAGGLVVAQSIRKGRKRQR